MLRFVLLPRAGLRCLFFVFLCAANVADASFARDLSYESRSELCDAVCSAELIFSRAEISNGTIQTIFTFRRIETLRGSVPAYFLVSAPGGILGDTAEADSRLPKLSPSGEYLLFLQRRGADLEFFNGAHGAVVASAQEVEVLSALCALLPPGADLNDFETEPIEVSFVTESGLFETNGVRRFTSPDSGQGIPVYADVSTLPTGLSEAEAITALQNALAAWEAASSIKFDYRGTQVFSQSAETFESSDGYAIRVQMHDNFDSIDDSSSTLGFGGGGFSINLGDGGTVNGSAYNPLNYGYVVMNHPKATLSDPVSFEAVLCHEIGHVIGLDHSSEDEDELDSELSEAMMYFLAQTDGRGATLNSHDTTTILKSHPANTPPVAYDRVFYAVTSPSQTTLSNPEVNQISIQGFDLQGDSLTIQQDSASTSYGSFALDGGGLTYTPSGFFGDNTVSDLGSEFYDRFQGRISDGVNLSPFMSVRIIGFRSDTEPSGAPDGIPDSWVSGFYGSADGALADSDTDGDGLDAKSEFLIGTDPTDANSKFEITNFSDTGDLEWTTQQFDLYEIETSTDLTTWTTERFVSQTSADPTMSVDVVADEPSNPAQFFRVIRVE